MAEFIYSAVKYLAGLLGLQHGFITMWEATRNFLELGGDILIVIGILMTIMWVMIIERLIYFARKHPILMRQTIAAWNSRRECRSWYAHKVRGYMISEVKMKANRSLDLINVCVVLCPLLGLLGIVSGTVKILGVMATLGTDNPRAIALTVSQAAIPAMSGMVAALSGIFLSVWLQRKASMEVEFLREQLSLDH